MVVMPSVNLVEVILVELLMVTLNLVNKVMNQLVLGDSLLVKLSLYPESRYESYWSSSHG
jgi:hypothetical protein